VHRDHLVDGPKDREHPVSGMAKYGRISNVGHRMTDCSKSCPVPTPGDGQRLDVPSSGDRWTRKAAEDQPRDFATARATPLQIDGKVMHADAITSPHLTAYPMPSPLSDDRAPQAIKSRPGEDLGSAEVGVAPRPGVFVGWHLGVSGRSILVSNLFPEPPPGILPRTRWKRRNHVHRTGGCSIPGAGRDVID
jgi:hypothetical protein